MRTFLRLVMFVVIVVVGTLYVLHAITDYQARLAPLTEAGGRTQAQIDSVMNAHEQARQ